MRSRRFSSERGGALVEAAFALPVLALLLIGTTDFGRLFYHTMAVTEAARAGAQYGTFLPGRASDFTGMENAAAAAGVDLPSGVSPDAGRTCFCYESGAETSIGCSGSVCAGQRRVYVTVTASSIFSTVVNYPGIPRTVTITRAARMRAQ